MSQTVTRREAVSSIAAVALGGGALLTLGDSARAQGVQIDGFEVADATHESPDGMVDSVRAIVNAEYAFEATRDVSTVELELRAGRSESTTQEIAAEHIPTTGQTGSGSATLDGPLTYANDFDIRDFRPSKAGETVAPEVVFELRVRLVNGTEQLAQTAATTTAVVEVTQQDDVLTVEIGGSGSFDISG